jgi:hypothetical protein
MGKEGQGAGRSRLTSWGLGVLEPFERFDVFLGDFAPGAISVDPHVAGKAALEPLAVEVDLGQRALAEGAAVVHCHRGRRLFISAAP